MALARDEEAVVNFGLDQIGLTIFGVLAVALTNSKDPHVVRYACFAGLAAEPFWLWSSWIASQPGIMALSFVYGWYWWQGLKRDWL